MNERAGNSSDGTIRLAISTCPNDTFAFHGLLTGKVDTRGLSFDIQLLDIEQLNEGLMNGAFDVAKASFHAALALADDTVVLPVGSALGFGVGPLLLAAREGTRPTAVPGGSDDLGDLTLCPGQWTTAHLLFRLFYGGDCPVRQVVFSEIMPRLKERTAGFGVCIHEGRFTWQAEGLACVEDLGTRWESETGAPLPLGGLLGRRSLGPERLRVVSSVIRDSLEYGLAHRGETEVTMRRYAQEFSREVLFRHVDLYVNEWTRDLAEEGRLALQELGRRAGQVNAATRGELEVLGDR